jgi:hypothetical protein
LDLAGLAADGGVDRATQQGGGLVDPAVLEVLADALGVEDYVA